MVVLQDEEEELERKKPVEESVCLGLQQRLFWTEDKRSEL